MDISAKINDLLEQRNRIDETLASITALLGNGKVGRPASAPPITKRRRGRANYDMTADEFVLSFVKEFGSPTTKDINANWKQIRKGSADNTIGRLVKMKKLKRVPLPGERGSRYEVRA